MEAETRQRLADAALEEVDGVAEWTELAWGQEVRHRVDFRLERMVAAAHAPAASLLTLPGCRTVWPHEAKVLLLMTPPQYRTGLLAGAR